MRDIKGIKSFGHIGDDAETGLSTYLRPKGVIAAIVASQPLATPVNNIINALKCGNAIIVAPSPKGARPGGIDGPYSRKPACDRPRYEPCANGAHSPSKVKTNRLMELADLLVVTGSQNNVRAGYSSGTPALGVGQGNVVTIIDDTADLSDAAPKVLPPNI